ncbi:hypothetical protein [Rhodococcus sp. IEGM 1307]|uniref:hypothetical protein n=1 Tax=Rhodococcus sp. IEGM 1307 TaxID=3047091 RepID=UPI0024B654BC|nr:hypothetical protein [Rhodococcus sp. IEGM 1307]MDI9979335.1 hypothetical protein [Rhodococcus sp. IEGM 1307]
MTGNAATTPPLGKILTADEIARFAYPTGPVAPVDEELALAALARAYGEWRGALGLPDLAEKARTLLPETTGSRAAFDTDTVSGLGV